MISTRTMGRDGATLRVLGWDGSPLVVEPLGGAEPLGFAAGDANIYRYVGNEPTDLVDPSGLADKPIYPGYKKLKEQFSDAPDWPDILKDKDVGDTIKKDFTAPKEKNHEIGGWVLWNPRMKDSRISHDGALDRGPNCTVFKPRGPQKFDNGDPIGDYIVIGFYHTHPTNDSPSPADYDDSHSKGRLPGLIIGPKGKLTTYYQEGGDPRKGVKKTLN